MVQPLAVLHALSALTLVLALAMGAPLVVAELLDDGARFAFEGGMLATVQFASHPLALSNEG